MVAVNSLGEKHSTYQSSATRIFLR